MKSILAMVLAVPLVQSAGAMDWVYVGNTGNSADNSTGYGAVDYGYSISKNEVSIAQYAEFLNATAATDTYGLYNTEMGTDLNVAGISRSGSSGSYTYSVMGGGDRPITYVSWFDAARFVNWTENGYGAGSTETGTYALNGATSGTGFTADENALHRIPTEDEWYKAAYYDPTKGEADDADNYWLHALQDDALVNNSESANYFDMDYATTQSPVLDSTLNYLTDVGIYTGSESYYGTFDQGGSVSEWSDAVISGTKRGLRGGSWRTGPLEMRSLDRTSNDPTFESSTIGFRIVPEPSSSVLVMLGGISMMLLRRRG